MTQQRPWVCLRSQTYVRCSLRHMTGDANLHRCDAETSLQTLSILGTPERVIY